MSVLQNYLQLISFIYDWIHLFSNSFSKVLSFLHNISSLIRIKLFYNGLKFLSSLQLPLKDTLYAFPKQRCFSSMEDIDYILLFYSSFLMTKLSYESFMDCTDCCTVSVVNLHRWDFLCFIVRNVMKGQVQIREQILWRIMTVNGTFSALENHFHSF